MLQVESYKKGIVLSSAFNVFNKGLVFINSLLIAFYFGTQIKIDIYFYAYNTVVIVATFLSAANTSVVIPESMRIRIRNGEKQAEAFLNLFIYGFLALTVMLALIFWWNPVRIFTAISRYNPETLAKEVRILIMAVPLLMLISLTTLLTDILASYRYFTVPVIASLVNSLFSLTFLIIFHRSLDIQSVLLGLLISYSVNIIMLLSLMKKKLNWDFKIKPGEMPRKALENILFAQTGNFLTSLGSYAPLYFLSGTGVGVIASLNYAQQLVTQANAFITVQVSTVSRIKLSELYVQKKYKRVNEIFISTIRFLLFLLIPISGLMFLYSEDIITILFRRGSFNERSVTLSADMLKWLAVSLPFTAIISIAGNLYAAAQLIRISIVYQVISNALLILFLAFLVNRVGYMSYPFAYLGINILNVLVVYIYCINFFPFIKYKQVLKYLVILIGYNAAIILILTGLNQYRQEIGNIQVMLIGGILYAAAILGLSFIFKLNEDFNNLILKMWQRFGLVKS